MQHVVDEALHLYSQHGSDDPDALAERLGIGVYDVLDADHLTEIYFPDLRAIVLRPGMPAFQRRYLLAHALGHHVLHRTDEAHDYLKLHLLARDAGKHVDPRIKRAESEADLFASYLLIPEAKLQPLLARPWTQQAGDVVQQLSIELQFPPEPMRVRLAYERSRRARNQR